MKTLIALLLVTIGVVLGIIIDALYLRNHEPIRTLVAIFSYILIVTPPVMYLINRGQFIRDRLKDDSVDFERDADLVKSFLIMFVTILYLFYTSILFWYIASVFSAQV